MHKKIKFVLIQHTHVHMRDRVTRPKIRKYVKKIYTRFDFKAVTWLYNGEDDV